MVEHPSGLVHLASTRSGRAWLDGLDTSVDRAIERWGLRVSPPFDDCHVSWVARASLPGGHPVALKIPFPHDEATWEGEALRRWDGIGAIRLLDHDPASGDLLLELAEPGRPLSALELEPALDVVVDTIRALAVTADAPFRRVEDDGARWIEELAARWDAAAQPYPRRLLDAALELLASELPRAKRSPPVLIHQDLHGENIVESARGWLAIDPKPVVGPLEFAVAPVVRSFEFGHSRAHVYRRFDRLVEELELDSTGALAWTVSQTLAWSTEPSTYAHLQHEVVDWLVERV